MSPQPQTIPETKSGWRLESRAAALERFVERHQVWILALWTVVYFAGTMLRAHGKPFWFDELLTLLEARQPTLSAAMRAMGDVDWMPPANHFVFYLSNKLIGSSEVTFRIPPMIAFWVFCICLYLFARRRVSIFFALTAMLLPYASAFQAYSYEARSYAFVLGFCGIALVSWQAAAEGRKRPWSLVGLALALAGALAFHYWAVLIYLPLAGAEAYRSIRLHRIDWPVWAAFFAGGLSLVAALFLILHGIHNWNPNSGMRVYSGEYIDSYTIGFRVFFSFAIPAALLLAAWFFLGGAKEKPEGTREAAIPDYEWVAAVLLLFIPIVAISIALAVPPHAFAPRYAASAVGGYALLGAFLLARAAGKRSAIGLAFALAAFAPFLYLMTTPRRFVNPFYKLPGLERRVQSGPVVVENLISFLQLWYYAPDSLKPRILCLTDLRPHNRYGTPYDELSRMGIPVVRYNDFARPGTDFVYYAHRKHKLQNKIEADGGTVERVGGTGRHIVMLAHVK